MIVATFVIDSKGNVHVQPPPRVLVRCPPSKDPVVITSRRRERLNKANKKYRDKLRSEGICVNGRGHGKSVTGNKCQVCADRDKRKRAAA